VLRDPDEHELLVEQAAKEGLVTRFDAHVGWRAGAATLFVPGGDLERADLASAIAVPWAAATRTDARALVTNNAVLFEVDAGRRNLVEMAAQNPRIGTDFPDLREAGITLREGRLPDGRRVVLMTEAEAPWPLDAAAWSESDVNGIRVSGGVLYEVAINLGQMGPRATLLVALRQQASARGARLIVADLGARDGDLGLERLDRARLDYGMLTKLGYQLVVPYEFELALGAPALAALRKEHAGLTWLASNLKAAGAPGLLQPRHIVDVDGVRIGFIGLVDPDLAGLLSRASLQAFTFEAPVVAAAREAAELRRAGAQAVVALSNLHPRDNNRVAREVSGIDAIVADLHVRWSPEAIHTRVEMPDRPRSRPGSPAIVARSFANGLGLGTLDLEFRAGPDGRRHLAALDHTLSSVTDRTPADIALVRDIQAQASAAERPRGPVLVPAFPDLVKARPALARFDATAQQGRISKRMWEEFLARLIRAQATCEVGIIRKLPHFPPAVGALREADVRAWLWTEDAVVTVDLAGADLRAILAADTAGDLVVVGLDRQRGTVNGRRIQDGTHYRVATTDQLLESARFRAFEQARRIERRFSVGRGGTIEPAGGGEPLPLRQYVLDELARAQAARTPAAEYLSRLLDRDPVFEPLVTFSFDRPTIFASANRSANTEGYGSVPESRVVATDSQVIGVSGRYVLGYERERLGLELGALAAFSRNRVRTTTGRLITSEPADDLRADLTLRARRGVSTGRVQPFVRGALDTEFTQSIDPDNGQKNDRQWQARGSGGLSRIGARWTLVEVAAAFESDLMRGSQEWGIEAAWRFDRRVRGAGRVSYRWDNALAYYFPANSDDETDLGLTYRTIHEILIPLVDELSLSIAADVFVFRGKVPVTSQVGASAILRVGLSYDRLWKPRYQPFF
jgi:hypothetical protein